IAGSGKRAGATTKMADLGTIKSPVHDHAGELLISKSATVELIEPSSLMKCFLFSQGTMAAKSVQFRN
ncbi:MAG: hypothetical protein O9306_07415, partial [Beijerinckiaceae bacterium]|nr:hypothetical protein [Beijerinckiaceae bacterium]